MTLWFEEEKNKPLLRVMEAQLGLADLHLPASWKGLYYDTIQEPPNHSLSMLARDGRVNTRTVHQIDHPRSLAVHLYRISTTFQIYYGFEDKNRSLVCVIGDDKKTFTPCAYFERCSSVLELPFACVFLPNTPSHTPLNAVELFVPRSEHRTVDTDHFTMSFQIEAKYTYEHSLQVSSSSSPCFSQALCENCANVVVGGEGKWICDTIDIKEAMRLHKEHFASFSEERRGDLGRLLLFIEGANLMPRVQQHALSAWLLPRLRNRATLRNLVSMMEWALFS